MTDSARDCGAIPELGPNQNYIDPPKETTYPASFSVECLQGFEWDEGNHSFTISCTAEGIWNALNAHCVPSIIRKIEY